MNAGKLSERITFQSVRRTPDGGGGTVDAWANVDTSPTVWANVVAKSGTERMVADRMAASMVTLFQIYSRSDLDETMRIIWRGAAYNIRGIRRQGTREPYLTIEAERGVAS